MKSIPVNIPKLKISTRALIDDEDYDKISCRKWLLAKGYALSTTRGENRKVVSMHRLLMRPPDGFVVDHINGNKLDNRKGNLRVCIEEENKRNRPASRRNKLGVKGVSRRGNSFYASISKGRLRKHLGSFPTVEKASEAYRNAAIELFGDFAKW